MAQDPGHRDVVQMRVGAAELLGVGGLDAVVQLVEEATAELVDEGPEVAAHLEGLLELDGHCDRFFVVRKLYAKYINSHMQTFTILI